MIKEIIAKPLQIKTNIEGIGIKGITEHFKLYEGYVKKTNEIRAKMIVVDKALANSAYSDIGELKRQESFSLNGVKLHEIYFRILGGDGVANGNIAQKIKTDFETIDNWIADMTAAGLSARGWVITSYDIADGTLRNYSADTHNIGIIAGSIPLIALDVYEHAYFMDYGTNRREYIETFFRNLNWEEIDKIASEYKLLT